MLEVHLVWEPHLVLPSVETNINSKEEKTALFNLNTPTSLSEPKSFSP
jgi:hypothetical protein